jgi:hypothetical protein
VLLELCKHTSPNHPDYALDGAIWPQGKANQPMNPMQYNNNNIILRTFVCGSVTCTGVKGEKATTQGLALIAFLSGNAFDADNLPNYHNDHIRGVGVSGHVMPLTRGLFTLEM